MGELDLRRIGCHLGGFWLLGLDTLRFANGLRHLAADVFRLLVLSEALKGGLPKLYISGPFAKLILRHIPGLDPDCVAFSRRIHHWWLLNPIGFELSPQLPSHRLGKPGAHLARKAVLIAVAHADQQSSDFVASGGDRRVSDDHHLLCFEYLYLQPFAPSAAPVNRTTAAGDDSLLTAAL